MTPTDLIERLEKATGRSRELDARIAATAGLPMTFCDFDTGCYHGDCNSPGCGEPLGLSDERKSYPRDWRDDERLPHYTSSIDAALSLVPEDWFLDRLGDIAFGEPGAIGIREYIAELHNGADGIEARGSTRAIALCIASLKSIAAIRSVNSTGDK